MIHLANVCKQVVAMDINPEKMQQVRCVRILAILKFGCFDVHLSQTECQDIWSTK